MPEFFGLEFQRRPPADHCPELPSELPMNIAERPPAAQEVLTRCIAIALCEMLVLSAVSKIALDLLLKRFDHPRYSYQYRDPLPPDGCHDIGWIERVLKDD